MTAHQQQFAAEIRRSVQTTLMRGLSDPRIRGLVSVTSIDLAPDHSQAVINVSVLPAEHGALTLEGLKSATNRVRLELGEALSRRRVPRLEWRLDQSLKKQAEIDAALARAAGRADGAMDVSHQSRGVPRTGGTLLSDGTRADVNEQFEAEDEAL